MLGNAAHSSLASASGTWFNDNVKNSDEPWVFLIFDSTDGSDSVYPIYEEVSTKMHDFVKFGHADIAGEDGRNFLYKKLNLNARLFPVLVRYHHSTYTEMFNLGRDYGEGGAVKGLRKWVGFVRIVLRRDFFGFRRSVCGRTVCVSVKNCYTLKVWSASFLELFLKTFFPPTLPLPQNF